MPAVHFTLRWPDGAVETCYSPSRAISDHLDVGQSYALDEFLERCRRGLHAASDRVGMLYGGSGCSMAMAQLAAIERKARSQSAYNGSVTIEGFDLRG